MLPLSPHPYQLGVSSNSTRKGYEFSLCIYLCSENKQKKVYISLASQRCFLFLLPNSFLSVFIAPMIEQAAKNIRKREKESNHRESELVDHLQKSIRV